MLTPMLSLGIESFLTKLTTSKIVNRTLPKLLSLFVLTSVGVCLVRPSSLIIECSCISLTFDRSTGTPLQNRVGELYSLIRFVGADPYAYYYCKRCDCKSLHWLCTKGPCTVSPPFLAVPPSSLRIAHFALVTIYRNAVTRQCNTSATGITKS